jgi:hypothetical protein
VFGADKVAVVAKRPPQRKDLNLKVLLHNGDPRPGKRQQLLFGDQRSVSLEQGQQNFEGTRSQLDRDTVRQQHPLAQQYFKPAEFERGFVCGAACAIKCLRP